MDSNSDADWNSISSTTHGKTPHGSRQTPHATKLLIAVGGASCQRATTLTQLCACVFKGGQAAPKGLVWNSALMHGEVSCGVAGVCSLLPFSGFPDKPTATRQVRRNFGMCVSGATRQCCPRGWLQSHQAGGCCHVQAVPRLTPQGVVVAEPAIMRLQLGHSWLFEHSSWPHACSWSKGSLAAFASYILTVLDFGKWKKWLLRMPQVVMEDFSSLQAFAA